MPRRFEEHRAGFPPLDFAGFDTLLGWFSDAERGRRVDKPTAEWFRWVTEVSANHAWLIFEGGKPVGHVQLDALPNRTGGVGLIVRPDLRGRGIGMRTGGDSAAGCSDVGFGPFAAARFGFTETAADSVFPVS